jgi:TolB-like protein/DNA-binding winged helix-turn-helix (wHTH) protein/Tfp pilus assembly protein PilF
LRPRGSCPSYSHLCQRHGNSKSQFKIPALTCLPLRTLAIREDCFALLRLNKQSRGTHAFVPRMSLAKPLKRRELSAVLPQFELLRVRQGVHSYDHTELGMATSAGRILRFGSFEANVRAGELRKQGFKVRLQDQPFQILLMLLERPGELVTRKEIHQKLWPADTFVGFDHGLNNAINRLREALGDSAEKPRFIETLPRKGYRFIGLVSGDEQLGETEYPAVAATPVVEPGPVEQKLSARPRFPVAILVSCLAVSLAVIVYIGWRRMHADRFTSSGHVMLAVLPFQNLSGDPSQDYFSDGLTEEMIAQLGALSPDQLGVIARTTTMAYKHTSKSVEQIGSELGVGYVLESSVRRDGNQVRISVQLIRVHDQVHVWARSYDRHISHSIELQEEVAKAVAEQIEVELSPSYKGRTNPHHLDAEANEAYLRGRYFWNQFTPEGYRKAISYFQQAIARDSNFAEAYSGLADSYNFLVVTDSIPASEGHLKALEAARRAVSLGVNLAEPHASLAVALGRSEWNWSGAEDEYKRAIALNPSYSMVHRFYASLLGMTRRHDEAWEQINEAMRLDPLSLPNNAEIVRTLYYARNYDQAIEQGLRAMQLDPNYVRTHFWMGRVYSQKGMHREAIAASEKILESMPDSTLGLTEMAYSLAVAGRRKEARQILLRLEGRSTSAFVPAYDLAVIYIALNEEEVAVRYMQQAYENRDWALVVLAVEPRLDPLRSDPRFQEILAKLNLQ